MRPRLAATLQVALILLVPLAEADAAGRRGEHAAGSRLSDNKQSPSEASAMLGTALQGEEGPPSTARTVHSNPEGGQQPRTAVKGVGLTKGATEAGTKQLPARSRRLLAMRSHSALNHKRLVKSKPSKGRQLLTQSGWGRRRHSHWHRPHRPHFHRPHFHLPHNHRPHSHRPHSHTPAPTNAPTPSPTDAPTPSPTNTPTASPTDAPTASPTDPAPDFSSCAIAGGTTTTNSVTKKTCKNPGTLVALRNLGNDAQTSCIDAAQCGTQNLPTQALAMLKYGLDMRVFATVATLGTAKNSSGTGKYDHDSWMEVLCNMNMPTSMSVPQRFRLTANIYDASCNDVMTLVSRACGVHPLPNCVCDGSGNTCDAHEQCGKLDFDLHSSDLGLLLATHLSQKQWDIEIFAPLWSAAVRGSYSCGELVRWDQRHAASQNKAAGMDCPWPVPGDGVVDPGDCCDAGMAAIDLCQDIGNTVGFKALTTECTGKPGSVEGDAGCNFRASGAAAFGDVRRSSEQIHSMYHTYLYKPMIQGMQMWIKDEDELVIYQAQATTAGLYQGCQSELSWTMDVCDSCCCNVGDEMGLVRNSMSHCITSSSTGDCSAWFLRVDKTFRQYMALLRAAVLARKNSCCEDFTASGSSFETTWGLSTQDVCAGDKHPADDELEELTDTTTGCSTDGAGFSDVTDDHRDSLEISCTEHMYGHWESALKKGEWQWGPDVGDRYNAPENTPAGNLKLKQMSKEIWAERIVCAEKTYPDDARNAFTPLMGGKFFPPRIQKDSANDHQLILSCGDQNLELYGYRDLFMYMRDNEATDAAGNAIGNLNFAHRTTRSNSLAVTKMDGGLRGTGPRPSDRQGPWPNRPLQGGTTSTCCPPLGYAGTTEQDQKACERNLFGETTRCQSKFHLTILVCDTCDCLNSQNQRELVKVKTKHAMVENLSGTTAACSSWFTLVDAGVRTLVGKVREQVSNAKVASCVASSSSESTAELGASAGNYPRKIRTVKDRCEARAPDRAQAWRRCPVGADGSWNRKLEEKAARAWFRGDP